MDEETDIIPRSKIRQEALHQPAIGMVKELVVAPIRGDWKRLELGVILDRSKVPGRTNEKATKMIKPALEKVLAAYEIEPVKIHDVALLGTGTADLPAQWGVSVETTDLSFARIKRLQHDFKQMREPGQAIQIR